MTMMQIYWFTRLDAFKDILVGFTFISIIVSIICSIIISGITCNEGFDEVPGIIKKLCLLSAISAIFLILFQSLIPTTKEMAFIYIVPKISNSALAQKMGTDFVQIEALATEYIKDKLEVKK